MARNIDDIQRDIERTRRQLAGTLDELAERTRPANIAADAKDAATAKLKERNVQLAIAGTAAVVIGLVVFGVVRSKKRSKDLKDLRNLLAQR